jgi:hypothetical protein
MGDLAVITKAYELNPSAVLKLFVGISSKQLKAASPHQVRGWINTINRKLALERNRGLSRHYRYNLNRHLALASVHRILLARLQ